MMWLKSYRYAALERQNSDMEEQHELRQHPNSSRALLATAIVSVLLNLFLVMAPLRTSVDKTGPERTAYAHLREDSPQAWQSKSPYFGEDDTVADILWDEISIDNGTVALDDSYAASLGLPLSQRFPWDQDKGLYLLNGYHSLHCLKTIRQVVLEFDRGVERSEPTGHVLHCLDALRQDVLCYADDTPRYTGFQPAGRSGTGQTRQCRDWNKLEAWAQTHTACWRYINPHDPDFDLLQRHRFCPEGSPYIAKLKDFFGED